MIKTATCLSVVVLIAALQSAGAAGVARAVMWPPEIGERIAGARVDADGNLRVAARGSADLVLLEIQSQDISEPFFSLRTRVQNRRVDPAGWLQMDVELGPEEVYFSRQPLVGDSPWRPLLLPFNATGANGGWRTPRALRLRLILPGGGEVALAPLKLAEAGSWEEISRAPGAWWSVTGAGWIGAVGGGLLGVLGALAGVLIGRGRARGLAMTICWLGAGAGVAALMTGLIALARDQDYAVYYPLLLIGVLGVVMFPLVALGARRRYANEELRRMRARDA